MRRIPAPRWVEALSAAAMAFTVLLAPSARADHFARNIPNPAGPESPEAPDRECPGANCQCKGDPVSVYSGKWFYQTTDLDVPGVFPIKLVRHYDASTTYQSPLGFGWAFNYDMRLFEYADGSIVVRSKCGLRHRYVPGIDPDTWEIETLERNWHNELAPDPVTQGGYLLKEPGGTIHAFDAEGRLVETRNAQGNVLQFTYSLTKRPITGTSPYAVDPATPLVVAHQYLLEEIAEKVNGDLTGRKVTFEYDLNTGRLKWAETHDERRVTYTHEEVDVEGSPLPTGNLSSVMLPDGVVQVFTYDSGDPKTAHRVESIQQGQGMAAYTNSYDAEGRVWKQIFGNRETRFIFDPSAEQLDYEADFTTTDRECGVDVDCRLVERDTYDDQIPPNLLSTARTLYKYDARGLAVEVIDALGNQTLHTYETARPYLDKTEVFLNQGSPAAPNRVLEKSICFDFNAEGNPTQSITILNPGEPSPQCLAQHLRTITESWVYLEGWVQQHTLVSSEEPDKTFKTEYTFERGGAFPGDLQDPITNVREIKRFHFAAVPPEVTTFHYDAATGQIQATVLPDGHTIRRTYYTASDDGPGRLRNGRLKEVFHEDDQGALDPHLKVTYDYDSEGNVSTITDARDNPTQQIWDDGRLLRVDNALGESTIFTYRGIDGVSPGSLLREIEVGRTDTEGEGQITRFLYDSLGNQVEVQRRDDAGVYRTFSTATYDSDGNALTRSDAEGRKITLGYDVLGRLTSTQDLAGHRTEFRYDASGNQVRTIDAEEVDRVFVYDGLDRLIEALEPDLDSTATTEFGYDAAGNLTSITDARDHTTAYEYDGLSRLRKVTRPLIDAQSDPVTVIEYEYDLRGRLQEWTNGRGGRLVYDYETWGPIKSVEHYADGTAGSLLKTVAYGYDNAGNLLTVDRTHVQPPSSETLYSSQPADYDALNRLRRVAMPYLPGAAKQLSYDYDRFGNRESVTLTEGTTDLAHTYAYNKLNRLEDVVFPGSQAFHFDYLDNDDLDVVTHPSGLSTTYGYETHGPLSSIAVTGTPQAVTTLEYLARDALDRVETLRETTDAGSFEWGFSYDSGGRLDDASYPPGRGLPTSGEDFAYDLVGNREDPDPGNPNGWDYDANDRIQASPGRTYDFDADGNLESITEGAATTALAFDIQNRLTSYDAGSATYDYDPFGRRIRKTTVNGTTTWYLWDGDQLLAEYDASGTRVARYAYAGGFAPRQYATGSSPEAIYEVHTDHLDTPRALTDSSKTVVWRASYEAFGKAAIDEDPDGANGSVAFPIRFPGQYEDAESGFHYNRFRYYDPALGRYISADPIGQAGDYNVYRYALGDPANNSDPLGLCPWCLVIPGICAGGACELLGIGVGVGVGIAIGNSPGLTDSIPDSIPDSPPNEDDDSCKPCPPCKTVSGRIVPVGTIAYRPLDTPSQPQHGIEGPHYNLYKANQNPNNCQCFWQYIGAVRPIELPPGAIPIEPFI